MKKLFTGFVFFFLSSLIAEAQFLSATLPDTYNPLTPNLDSNITTLNCYSHGNTYTAYIGYRMRNDGLLMNNRYWFLPQHQDSTILPAGSALSGQNDASPSLYAAYAQFVSGSFYLAYKNITWGTASFRPGATGIDKLNRSDDLFLYPNPFKDRLILNVPAGGASENYRVQIIDVSGRRIRNLSGKLSEINRQLAKNNVQPGIYLFRVQSNKISQTFKMVKE